MRDYTDTVDYVTGEDVPEKPMLCADCSAPVFYEDDRYWHAVSNPHPQCFGPMSWIAGDVDDPQHPAYAGWKEVHP